MYEFYSTKEKNLIRKKMLKRHIVHKEQLTSLDCSINFKSSAKPKFAFK